MRVAVPILVLVLVFYEFIEDTEMKCDVCGTEMTADILPIKGERFGMKKVTVEGIKMNCNGDHPEFDRIKDVFGKSEFHVCFVCWLTSLGVKRLDCNDSLF